MHDNILSCPVFKYSFYYFEPLFPRNRTFRCLNIQVKAQKSQQMHFSSLEIEGF